MEIKGNIGEEVYVKASIKKIIVDEEGIKYTVMIQNAVYRVDSEEVMFLEKTVKNAEKAEAPQPSKKRGRPRKTTVDDLMEKAQRVHE